MFVASPHASRVVKQLPGWPMGTLGNAGRAAGAPKSTTTSWGQELDFSAQLLELLEVKKWFLEPTFFLGVFYWVLEQQLHCFFSLFANRIIFGGWFKLIGVVSDEKPSTLNCQGWGKLRYHKCPHFSVETKTIQIFWLNCSKFQLAPHPFSWPQMATECMADFWLGPTRWADDEA